MKEWFEARMQKRVTIETVLAADKGGSHSGVVIWVGDDAVVLQLPNLTRLIAFAAIESAVEGQAF